MNFKTNNSSEKGIIEQFIKDLDNLKSKDYDSSEVHLYFEKLYRFLENSKLGKAKHKIEMLRYRVNQLESTPFEEVKDALHPKYANQKDFLFNLDFIKNELILILEDIDKNTILKEKANTSDEKKAVREDSTNVKTERKNSLISVKGNDNIIITNSQNNKINSEISCQNINPLHNKKKRNWIAIIMLVLAILAFLGYKSINDFWSINDGDPDSNINRIDITNSSLKDSPIIQGSPGASLIISKQTYVNSPSMDTNFYSIKTFFPFFPEKSNYSVYNTKIILPTGQEAFIEETNSFRDSSELIFAYSNEEGTNYYIPAKYKVPNDLKEEDICYYFVIKNKDDRGSWYAGKRFKANDSQCYDIRDLAYECNNVSTESVNAEICMPEFFLFAMNPPAYEN